MGVGMDHQHVFSMNNMIQPFIESVVDILSVCMIAALIIALYYVLWTIVDSFFLKPMQQKALETSTKVLVDEKEALKKPKAKAT